MGENPIRMEWQHCGMAACSRDAPDRNLQRRDRTVDGLDLASRNMDTNRVTPWYRCVSHGSDMFRVAVHDHPCHRNQWLGQRRDRLAGNLAGRSLTGRLAAPFGSETSFSAAPNRATCVTRLIGVNALSRYRADTERQASSITLATPESHPGRSLENEIGPGINFSSPGRASLRTVVR